jgi:hypothetical protein
MMELGAAVYCPGPGGERPRLLVAAIERPGAKPDLPADLAGHIAASYVRGDPAEAIADTLAAAFDKNEALKALLARPGRERYLSPAVLRDYSDELLRAAGVYERLSERLPTESAWRAAAEADLAALLGRESDLVPVLLKRVLGRLDEAGNG